jgi:sugar lactone lactonase YvrE
VHRHLLVRLTAAAAVLLALVAGAIVAFKHAPVGSPSFTLRATPATPVGWPAVVVALAGGRAPGSEDGPATQARFADPYGLAMAGDGTVYISDGGDNNRIRQIRADGTVATLAGQREGFADGQGLQAAFNTPSGIALDHDGNLYVADTGNNRIRKITPQGLVSTVAGDGQPGDLDGPAASARFNGPLGVAVDRAGTLYIADTYNDRIRVLGADGQVRTLAGGKRPGFADGVGAAAQFDTPCAIALGLKGELVVADTRNSAIRMVAPGGAVRTLARSERGDRQALLRRPISLSVTHDGVVYVGDSARGRLLQVTPDGAVHGLAGIGIDFDIGDDRALRLGRPAGLVQASDGHLLVTDASAYAVRAVMPATAAAPGAQAGAAAHAPASRLAIAAPVGTAAAAALAPAAIANASRPALATTPGSFPWPLKPQYGWHEIVGTMGEVRGNYDGESRDHFHSGLDVQAAMGTPVLAVLAEKVSSPTPNWGLGDIGEGTNLDTMAYIHMRVGRTPGDAPIDPARFQLLTDEAGKLERVRIKRGTRFAVGDTLGTVNRMFHVHLAYSPGGIESNPQAFPFSGALDHIAPRIESIELFDQAGQPLRPAARKLPLHLSREKGGVSIVVGAYDQVDGNAKRRRLGLYKVGYQVLRADGTPAPGFGQARMNVEFNALPPDSESVKVAYAGDSGITVHGNAITHFLYVVTNSVRDGHARAGSWQPSELPPGRYTIRITAADFAGNEATSGRDLPVIIE